MNLLVSENKTITYEAHFPHGSALWGVPFVMTFAAYPGGTIKVLESGL
jgi:hypothetical protein